MTIPTAQIHNRCQAIALIKSSVSSDNCLLPFCVGSLSFLESARIGRRIILQSDDADMASTLVLVIVDMALCHYFSCSGDLFL